MASDELYMMYRERERDRSIPNIHELTTRTVNMNRDQQADGSHGFGVCVKGGKDSDQLLQKLSNMCSYS
uniref:Uncharacterized protein n=1 Tax=Megaselia scalaris TaxID=36166 RepID=T1GQX7_MEGSC